MHSTGVTSMTSRERRRGQRGIGGRFSGAGLLPNITPLLESLGFGSLCAVSKLVVRTGVQSSAG
jgi:hypothetical protein